MIRFDRPLADRRWIDLAGPNVEDLRALSQELGLPLRPLLGCLDPVHLPKTETFGEIVFVILRVVDGKIRPSADQVEQLTTKIAVFMTRQHLVTIHRTDPEFVVNARTVVMESEQPPSAREVLWNLLQGAIASYEKPLDDLGKRTSAFDKAVFLGKRTGQLLKEGFIIKRRANAFRKVLKFTSDVIASSSAWSEASQIDIGALKERTDRLLFYTDEVLDTANGLLNLHVSLMNHRTSEAAYRSGEVMRVLTVFSIFFLPLNFIAGVYGMNFKFMPELDLEYGYYSVLGFMALVSIGIFTWMTRNGWLGSSELPDSDKLS